MADMATLENALRKADALAQQGDAQAAADAKVIADAIRAARPAEGAAAPTSPEAASGGRGSLDVLKEMVLGGQPAPEPMAPQGRLEGAAEGIVNDISGAFQGVSPGAVADQRGNAVGLLKTMPGTDMQMVDVDGTLEPVENYPPDQFVTRQERGASYIYPRTDATAENPLASAGRALGYGAIEGFKGPVSQQAHAAAAEPLGITPSFEMGGTAQAAMANAGKQFAPTAKAFRADSARAAGEMGGAAARIADKAGPGTTSTADAGEALRKGAETFVSGVSDKTTNLYKAVDKAIPPATPVDMTNTMAALAKEGDKLRKLPNTISPERLKAMESGNMNWEQARALRTDIGTALRSFDGSETNVAKGQLDQIYKALSQDLDAVVTAAGPAAKNAWTRANTYTRVSKERIERAFGKILGDKVTPEAAYSTLMRMTTEGKSSSDLDGLRQLFRSLPKEEAAQVSGTIIRRLGQAKPGAQDAVGEVFSPDTFLTNWNTMSKPARAIVANAGLDKGVSKELDKLATVVGRAKESGTFKNYSNTAGGVANLSIAGAAGAAGASLLTGNALPAIGFVASVVGSNLSAKALTNVTFLRAINAFAKSGQSGLLVRIARGGGELAEEAAKILRPASPTLEQQPQAAPARVSP
jgi:hypothetical protein